jgi:hypothetical protein
VAADRLDDRVLVARPLEEGFHPTAYT